MLWQVSGVLIVRLPSCSLFDRLRKIWKWAN